MQCEATARCSIACGEGNARQLRDPHGEGTVVAPLAEAVQKLDAILLSLSYS